MKKYISPESQELNFKFEGVIASSLVIGEGEGDQHYSEGMGDWTSVDWSGMSSEK